MKNQHGAKNGGGIFVVASYAAGDGAETAVYAVRASDPAKAKTALAAHLKRRVPRAERLKGSRLQRLFQIGTLACQGRIENHPDATTLGPQTANMGRTRVLRLEPAPQVAAEG